MDKATGRPEPDELDRKIDEALDRVGQFVWFWFRLLTASGIVGGLIWAIFFSPYAEVLSPIYFAVALVVSQVAVAVLLGIVLFVAIFWIRGRARAYWLMPGETEVGFSDYKGNPEILEVARHIVTLLRGVNRLKDMGGQVRPGLLLTGPPGVGKRYLVQCIATEAGVPFCYISAPSLQDAFLGISNLRIMMVYGKARKLAGRYGVCVVFVDEIDAIGHSREPGERPDIPRGIRGGGLSGGSGLLTELLHQMDPPRVDDGWRNRLLRAMGLRARAAKRPAVLTIGGTSVPRVLDAALLQPGRFDWKITVDAPDFDGRKEVIRYYLDRVGYDPQLAMDRLADKTIGYTPAAIRYLINESVVLARSDGREAVEYRDFTLALEMLEWDLRRPLKSMSWEERRRIAYHATGHAIAQVKLLPKQRLIQISIARHRDPGITDGKPPEEGDGRSIDELLAEIQIVLAGKAAEHVCLGAEFTGAGSDLLQATRIAGSIVGRLGMNGSLYAVGVLGDTLDPGMKREIEKLLDDQFNKVKHLLAEYRGAADEIVDRLLDKNDMAGDEASEIIRRFEARRDGQQDSPGIMSERIEHDSESGGAGRAPSSAQVPTPPHSPPRPPWYPGL